VVVFNPPTGGFKSLEFYSVHLVLVLGEVVPSLIGSVSLVSLTGLAMHIVPRCVLK